MLSMDRLGSAIRVADVLTMRESLFFGVCAKYILKAERSTAGCAVSGMPRHLLSSCAEGSDCSSAAFGATSSRDQAPGRSLRSSNAWLIGAGGDVVEEGEALLFDEQPVRQIVKHVAAIVDLCPRQELMRRWYR